MKWCRKRHERVQEDLEGGREGVKMNIVEIHCIHVWNSPRLNFRYWVNKISFVGMGTLFRICMLCHTRRRNFYIDVQAKVLFRWVENKWEEGKIQKQVRGFGGYTSLRVPKESQLFLRHLLFILCQFETYVQCISITPTPALLPPSIPPKYS